MEGNKGLLFSMAVLAALLAASGQLLFKFGLKGIAAGGWLPLLIGAAAYLASTAVYLTVLSRSHLSWAYGLNGISYIAAVIFALAFLNETIPPMRWVGVVVIAVGAALVGFS